MSTTAYDTAPRYAAQREATWQDSGHHDPHGPGHFAPRIYRGRTVDELIPTIVAELGEDAIVIRHHRGLTGGFAGFFQKSFVEIEARRGDPGGSLVDRYDDGDAIPALPEYETEKPTEVWATNPFAAALAEAEAAVRAAEPAVPPDLDAALAEALAEAEDAEAPEEIVVAPVAQDPYVEPVAATPPVSEPSAHEEIEQMLRSVGIGQELVQELIETANAHVMPLMPPATSLAQAVRTALTQMIPASSPLPAAGAAIAVIGAGGAGKSACCAALREAYREHSTLTATCVTILPGTMPEEQTLSEARAGGVLLLDTPPVSCADPGSISALAELLEQVRPERVVLALPATLGATPAAQLLGALGPLGADALAITHADETDQLGVAVQTACTFGLAPIHLLARAESAPGSWALTWTDPSLLADRLLPPR